MNRAFFEEMTTAELLQYREQYERNKETLPLDDKSFKRQNLNMYIYIIESIIYSRNKRERG
jgi:hypothetical protein